MSFVIIPTDGKSPVKLQGDWGIAALATIQNELNSAAYHAQGRFVLDGSEIKNFTLSAAATLQTWRARLKSTGIATDLQGFTAAQQRLFDMLPDEAAFAEQTKAKPKRDAFFTAVGKSVYGVGEGASAFIIFTGRAVAGFAALLAKPWTFRATSTIYQVYEIGLRATPIVALMAFLISIVIGYQGVSQLRNFGAEIYAVDLVGVSLLRELGILVTAIMVAGRSGSAFTAELGVMKTNEEIDALRAMGLDPFMVLVMPRMLGIIIALPILTMIANFAGLFGGFVMSISLLDMSPEQYFNRLGQALKLKSLVLGVLKAPFFAFLIGMVGCLRGFQVTGSSDAVGRYTTRAVVDSIFLVLTVDAIFSVIYSYLGY